jgi:hypothetical protein
MYKQVLIDAKLTRQGTFNVTLRRVRGTVVAVEKQYG